MASLGLGLEELPHDPPPEPAFHEAQKWIEQVTGRSFGDRDFRTGLENGILLCELLNAIKPGLVKKINRLPTPIAGLDNIILFLRGCKELGLKESQLFDPGDLQDTSNRVAVKSIDCSRKLKNVLVTIYWLGKAANSCTAYSGTTLNLKEFEGLLAQMRKETDDIDSPKRSIRDSGYIDCWDSERSDSLSPPRHGRDDSFDSLDSFGSRSQQTPSPDVVLRGSSDGRGSDSESDLPHRKLPDVKKDDMSARRTSHGELKSAVPFNQYLPNKSNQTAYVPAPLRRKKAERAEYRKSWSTATSPLGGERTFSYPETIEEEEQNEVGARDDEAQAAPSDPSGNPSELGLELNEQNGKEQSLPESTKEMVAQKATPKDLEEMRKRRRLEQAGIKIMPAAQRFASQKQISEEKEIVPDIILRKENPFLKCQSGHESETEDGGEYRLPDLEKDDFAARRARMNQTKATVPLNQLLFGPYIKKENDGVKQSSKGTSQKKSQGSTRNQVQKEEVKKIVIHQESLHQPPGNACETEEPRKAPDIQKDDLAKRKIQNSNLSSHREAVSFVKISSITEADLETWDRLKVSGKTSDEDTENNRIPTPSPEIQAETAIRDDFASRKARAYQKASSPKQKFVHFGPVTEIDQQKWRKLSIGKVGPKEEVEEIPSDGDKIHICHVIPDSAAPHSLEDDKFSHLQNSSKLVYSSLDENCKGSPTSTAMGEVQKQKAYILEDHLGDSKEATSNQLPQYDQKGDRLTKGDFETELKSGRCGNRSQQLANSVAPVNGTTGAEKSLEKMTTRGVQLGSGAREQRKKPDPQKDDMMARRTGAFLKHTGSNSNRFLPVPFAKQQQDGEESTKALQNKEERYGPRTAVSDDAESMSMLDMRCEEEAAVQPHSKARQEQLQFINSQLKEEDDKWQDDLARWKSRRRSASQDLIKKEAERKKMEKLLAGGDGTSERRKSIKTYREIVQEKERRERELHEAYKNARTREEAEGILQQYIERFTISEAVLERLEMPKILERSHSTEPNSSSLRDPNPMKYLRQQSLPPPKFTATVETTIAHPSELDPSVSGGSTSPSKTVVPKAVPMLTPKPYHQPKNTQQVLKTFKVDGKVSMNGETFNGVEEEKERECTTATFSPSLTRSQRFEGVARVDDSPVELKQDTGTIEISVKRANSLNRELTTSTTEEAELPPEKDETDCGQEESGNAECDSPESQHFTTTVTRASPTVAFVEFNPSHQPKEHEGEDKDQRKVESEMSGKVELVLSQKATKPKSPEPKAVLLFPYLNQVPETDQSTLPNLDSQVESNSSEKSPANTPRFNFWAWDPEEERRRQEKWQLEQERLLQERYQKEQDKLKEEWEKAQKEVEEEERRYYEEERKIIEDTVVPFTVSSNSADQLSTSSSVTEGNGPVNKMDLEDSKEEEKRQRPLWEEDNDLMLKNKKSDALEETSSVPQVTPAHPETSVPKGIHQDHQLSTTELGTPDRRLNLELSQDTSWNQPGSPGLSHASEDVKQKTLPVDQSINHQVASPSERRKTSPHENFRAGQLSPCSPTPPGQSPNRSISGKKLCSACGLPLGKGAAMIIETLSLYFHIQCFRCGICKGQLGDSVSGTDVRIRNGLLNCNDCYIRSRSAGQPTTL